MLEQRDGATGLQDGKWADGIAGDYGPEFCCRKKYWIKVRIDSQKKNNNL